MPGQITSIWNTSMSGAWAIRYSSDSARRSLVVAGPAITSTSMPVWLLNSAAAARSNCRPKAVELSDRKRIRRGPGEAVGLGPATEPGVDGDHGQSQAG